MVAPTEVTPRDEVHITDTNTDGSHRLSNGFRLHQQDNDLITALKWERFDEAKRIIEARQFAPGFESPWDGQSALDIVVGLKNDELFELLLPFGFNMNQALAWAAYYDRLPYLMTLLTIGADPRWKQPDTFTQETAFDIATGSCLRYLRENYA